MRGWLATRRALGWIIPFAVWAGALHRLMSGDASRRARRCFFKQLARGSWPGNCSLAAVVVEVEFLRPLAVFGGVCWMGSRVCFSARRGPAALAVVSQLAESACVLCLGLTALRFLGRVLPELAGLGRMKENSKVPPIARVCGFTQGSPPYMWRHLLQSLGVPRFPSAGRCTHIGIADHPPRLQTPTAQLTSGAGIRGNAFSPRFGRLDDPKRLT